MSYNVSVLESLLQDPDVIEIDVNAPDSIYYQHHWDGRKAHDQHFESEAEVRALAEELAAAENMTLDWKNPIVEVRLEDGSRIVLIIPPASPRGTVIRMMKAHPYDLTKEKLIEYGSMTQDVADFLTAAVQVGANIAVVGGHSSGKTTMLHVLYQQIPDDVRIVAVQSVSGFKVTHKNSVVLETRKPDLNGEGGITAAQLMAHVDILRPDRLIVSELEGSEFPQVLDMFSIGQKGMFGMEGTSSRDALSRLEAYATSGNLARPLLAVREQIARSLDLIVHISLMDTGFRRIVSVDEVRGVRGDNIELATIFELEANHETVATGVIPNLYETINNWQWSAIDLSEDVFKT